MVFFAAGFLAAGFFAGVAFLGAAFLATGFADEAAFAALASWRCLRATLFLCIKFFFAARSNSLCTLRLASASFLLSGSDPKAD